MYVGEARSPPLRRATEKGLTGVTVALPANIRQRRE